MTVHLAFPLRLVGGRPVTVEQDSPEHLADQVMVAASTPEGCRLEAPEFGVPAMVMQSGGVDMEELRAALARSVPDAAVLVERIASRDDLRRERLHVLAGQPEGT